MEEFKNFQPHYPYKEQLLGRKQILLLILCITFFISGPGLLGFFYYRHLLHKRLQDPQYALHIIEQTGPQKEALKTVYLAEILGLSDDILTSFYAFDTEIATQQLLSTPIIKSAVIKKKFPDKVYIDYTVRTPIAYIYEYTNTAIDKQKKLFPILPYFTPKILPQLYLGLSENDLKNVNEREDSAEIWGKVLEGEKVDLAFAILEFLSLPAYSSLWNVRYIDVSKAFDKHYGQKQIVVTIEEQLIKESKEGPILYVYPRTLRLSPKNYISDIKRYLQIRNHLRNKADQEVNIEEDNEQEKGQVVIEGKTIIIDLRLPQLAFMKEVDTAELGGSL
ncbi:MAG: hypothetical protein K0S74_874 [Chlamydiales bacterium]|jgi:hypothetical protein|nr:hypothetical protein [Chlamydiales bacterium]